MGEALGVRVVVGRSGFDERAVAIEGDRLAIAEDLHRGGRPGGPAVGDVDHRPRIERGRSERRVALALVEVVGELGNTVHVRDTAQDTVVIVPYPVPIGGVPGQGPVLVQRFLDVADLLEQRGFGGFATDATRGGVATVVPIGVFRDDDRFCRGIVPHVGLGRADGHIPDHIGARTHGRPASLVVRQGAAGDDLASLLMRHVVDGIRPGRRVLRLVQLRFPDGDAGMVAVAPDERLGLGIGVVVERRRVDDVLPSSDGVRDQDAQFIAGFVKSWVMGIVGAADELKSRLLDSFDLVVDRPFRDSIPHTVDVLMRVDALRFQARPVDQQSLVARPLDGPDAGSCLVKVDRGGTVLDRGVHGVQIGRIRVPQLRVGDGRGLADRRVGALVESDGRRGGADNGSLRVDDLGEDRTGLRTGVFVDHMRLDVDRRRGGRDGRVGDVNPSAGHLVGENRVGHMELVGCIQEHLSIEPTVVLKIHPLPGCPIRIGGAVYFDRHDIVAANNHRAGNIPGEFHISAGLLPPDLRSIYIYRGGLHRRPKLEKDLSPIEGVIYLETLAIPADPVVVRIIIRCDEFRGMRQNDRFPRSIGKSCCLGSRGIAFVVFPTIIEVDIDAICHGRRIGIHRGRKHR